MESLVFGWDSTTIAFGIILMLVLMTLAVLGFLVVARAMLKVSDWASQIRGRALEALRQRYADGEIDSEHFAARRRYLLGPGAGLAELGYRAPRRDR
jgi:uncharacterized membrane protein